jgi:flagellar biosynthesis/type III secretory pathway protein FliH
MIKMWLMSYRAIDYTTNQCFRFEDDEACTQNASCIDNQCTPLMREGLKMSIDNEEFAAAMWKAKITAAVETHNSGLHDGYQLGWAEGFKAGRTVSRAPAVLERAGRVPEKARRTRAKRIRRSRTRKDARALSRA